MTRRLLRSTVVGLAAVPVAWLTAVALLLAPELKRLVVKPPPAPLPPTLKLAGEELGGKGDAVADALDLVRRFARESVTIELR